MLRLESEGSKLATQQRGLVTDRISAISLSSLGKLWIASYYGVASLDHGHLESFATKKKGMPDLFYKALEDRRGTVWAI